MPTATADAVASSPSWPDLPFDLLRDISSRLHVAVDYVRFHAVCKPWRDTLPPAPRRRPAFLPWLLPLHDATTGHRRTARCLFSSKSGRRAASAICDLDYRRWVISADDGTCSCWLITGSCPDSVSLVNPLTGSAITTLPPFPDEIQPLVDHAVAAVSGDGTIFLYAFSSSSYHADSTFNVALLHPGNTAWTFVQRSLYVYPSYRDRCCVAYCEDKIVICDRSKWCIVSTQPNNAAAATGELRWRSIPDEPDMYVHSRHVVESGGELLWAFVGVQFKSAYYKDLSAYGQYCFSDVDSVASALSVSVYALQEAAAEGGGDELRWVKLDCRSLAGRVLFLGRPSSFAVDAVRVGMGGGGGCAYFVDRRRNLYGGGWSKSALDRCHVFKYSFGDDRSELVEQLPTKWTDEGSYMWIRPQPAIATTEEIGDRFEALNRKASSGHQQQYGAYFRIYVGNLPRKVDGYRLRQFFTKHGKVADARVVCDRGTKRSRGYGFVTMATAEDDEPADAIAKLHGHCLDGRPLRVKIADQEG